MVCSYLLRAYADLYFKCAIPHLRDRRRAAWDFVELKMFGTMPQLMGHLGDIGSMERLHASGTRFTSKLIYSDLIFFSLAFNMALTWSAASFSLPSTK